MAQLEAKMQRYLNARLEQMVERYQYTQRKIEARIEAVIDAKLETIVREMLEDGMEDRLAAIMLEAEVIAEKKLSRLPVDERKASDGVSEECLPGSVSQEQLDTTLKTARADIEAGMSELEQRLQDEMAQKLIASERVREQKFKAVKEAVRETAAGLNDFMDDNFRARKVDDQRHSEAKEQLRDLDHRVCELERGKAGKRARRRGGRRAGKEVEKIEGEQAGKPESQSESKIEKVHASESVDLGMKLLLARTGLDELYL